LKDYIIIDFDSTFIKIESLDELLKTTSERNKDSLIKIQKLTDMGMNGEISFQKSLSERIKLLNSNKNDLDIVIDIINKNVSDSFKKNKKFINENNDKIIIISGGFYELIYPVVSKFGIKKENIFANTFIYDKDGKIIGVDKNNPLSKNNGKVGDGYTDYEIKKYGHANKFYLFIENIKRKNILDKGDFLLKSLDDFIDIYNNE
jgi:D-3-phosphoglycerate dehydrogenase